MEFLKTLTPDLHGINMGGPYAIAMTVKFGVNFFKYSIGYCSAGKVFVWYMFCPLLCPLCGTKLGMKTAFLKLAILDDPL
jgi:hypothetical protein